MVDIRASRRVYRMSHLCCFGLVLERSQECSEIRAQPKITRRERTQEHQLLGCVRSVEWFLLSTMCATTAAELESLCCAHVGRRPHTTPTKTTKGKIVRNASEIYEDLKNLTNELEDLADSGRVTISKDSWNKGYPETNAAVSHALAALQEANNAPCWMETLPSYNQTPGNPEK